MGSVKRRELLGGMAAAVGAVGAQAQPLPRLVRNGSKPRNVIYILTDDHRYDAMGFTKGQEWLDTPQLDRLAREGCHFPNAFVTTALCSPSRASVLTGRYAHRHRIIDNNTPIPAGTTLFPQYLQQAGYATAFVGKWHMGGEIDHPQPGFDRWVSFKGQGTYLPSKNGLNVDGKRVEQKGYLTDELTDYAVDWLQSRGKDQPYFLYLAHKAVHAQFEPAARHKGKYAGKQFKYPANMEAAKLKGSPMWVQNQRNSWHGVEYPYHSDLDIAEFYRLYAETLCGVDDSVGRVLDVLKARGELDSTLVIYMGDNGFAFGEHGLIDKRTAYEESMRVPLIARCPELFEGGRKARQVVANIDIMPTVLDAMGLQAPAGGDGRSWLPVAAGRAAEWRKELLYEYYWERNYPQTPTLHALRGDRYKFIRCHGVWDLDELYDLQEDPLETNNLIFSEPHQTVVRQMRNRLFEILEETGGMQMPIWPDRGGTSNLRNPKGSKAAQFPAELERAPKGPAIHR
ncbi:MAG: sulfatase [Bryobacterales bacterium]|nr:sulfatase [Bryobacterales bacterium]